MVKIIDVLVPTPSGKHLQQGWSPQCKKVPAQEGAWGVLKTTAIQEGQFWPFENKALPGTLEPRPHIEVQVGDILMTCAGPRNRCGVTCLVRDTQPNLMLSGKMYRFRPDVRVISPTYLEQFLHSRDAKVAIDRMKTGISDSGLNLTHSRFAELTIPLPPIKEQMRITESLEELQSELDKANEILKLARKQIDLLDQSILENAFAGANDVIELRHLISQKLSNGYSGKPVKHTTDIRVLTLSATTSGKFDGSKHKYLDEEGLELRDIWCEPNDILIQRGNTIEYVGVPAIYTEAPRKYIFPDLMIRARADEEKISTKYLYFALSSPRSRNYLRTKAKGSAGTMPKISQAILNTLPIPYFSREIQGQIVSDIETRISNSSFIRHALEESIEKTGILRQSILKKAFSGQLVDQDPNDEPALVGLERIKAENARQTKPGKKKKRKCTA